jgi:hypothetical protein
VATKLTIPPRPSNGVTHASDRHRVMRERVFEPAQLQSVFLLIHESRTTGTLLLDLHQGGIRNIRLQEEQPLQLDEKG